MKIKKFIAVHHGKYDRNKRALTPEGAKRISYIAAAIKAEIGDGSKVCLLTSRRDHAIEAAKIIGNVLGVKPKLCMALQIDYMNYEADICMQHEAILRHAHGCDTVITVSHAETQAGVIHASSGIKPKKMKGYALLHSVGSADIKHLPA